VATLNTSNLGMNGVAILDTTGDARRPLRCRCAELRLPVPGRSFTNLGPNPTSINRFRGATFYLEQAVGKSLTLQLSGDANKPRSYGLIDYYSNQGYPNISIDINRQLPDGTANPNFLQPYNEFSRQERQKIDSENQALRLAAAYTKSTRWFDLKTNLIGAYESQESFRTREYFMLPVDPTRGNGASSPARTARRPSATATTGTRRSAHPGLRAGVGGRSRRGHDAHLQSPLGARRRPHGCDHPGPVGDEVLPGLRPPLVLQEEAHAPRGVPRRRHRSFAEAVPRGDGPPGGCGPHAREFHLPSGGAGGLLAPDLRAQGRGRRRPTGARATAAARPRDTAGVGLAQYANDRFQNDYNPPAVSLQKSTKAVGGIYNVGWGVSVWANLAQTFNPANLGSTTIDYGTPASSVSEGLDYGLRVSFGPRFYATISRYESEEANAAISQPSGYSNINLISPPTRWVTSAPTVATAAAWPTCRRRGPTSSIARPGATNWRRWPTSPRTGASRSTSVWPRRRRPTPTARRAPGSMPTKP
jgi:hypothetical protein